MLYLPTRRIFQKLIRFATKVKNPLLEFNHLEAKTDPRKDHSEDKSVDEPQGVDP